MALFRTMLCGIFVFVICVVVRAQDATTTTTIITEAATIANVASTTPVTNLGAVGRKYLAVDDLPTCRQSADDFGECVKTLFNIMLPRLKNGNAELNIPPIDPFALNRTTLQYSNGAVSGRLTMRSGQIFGVSTTQVKKADIKFKDGIMKSHVNAYIPTLKIAGKYKADVSFNNARIRPRGNFSVVLSDVQLEEDAENELYENDGHKFVRFTKFDSIPVVSNMKFDADGIFPDPTLNELVVNVTNQYWREIYRILLPETRSYWQPLILRVLNEAMAAVPFDRFVTDA